MNISGKYKHSLCVKTCAKPWKYKRQVTMFTASGGLTLLLVHYSSEWGEAKGLRACCVGTFSKEHIERTPSQVFWCQRRLSEERISNWSCKSLLGIVRWREGRRCWSSISACVILCRGLDAKEHLICGKLTFGMAEQNIRGHVVEGVSEKLLRNWDFIYHSII